jgi:hypothetical protein
VKSIDAVFHPASLSSDRFKGTIGDFWFTLDSFCNSKAKKARAKRSCEQVFGRPKRCCSYFDKTTAQRRQGSERGFFSKNGNLRRGLA